MYPPQKQKFLRFLGLYSHITHSVDKDEAEIPPPFKGQNQSKPEVGVNLKENLKVTDKTHQKTQRQMSHILMITLIIIIIMIIILPQVKIEAADLLLVKAVADNLEASYSQRPQYNPHQFQNYRFQRGTYQSNRNQYSSHCKPYF